jgi:hypothetical protein
MSDIPELAEHLKAGRHAAYCAMRIVVASDPRHKWDAGEPEDVPDVTCIEVNGGNILPAIDAAILETVARLSPSLIVTAPDRLRYLRPGELPL